MDSIFHWLFQTEQIHEGVHFSPHDRSLSPWGWLSSRTFQQGAICQEVPCRQFRLPQWELSSDTTIHGCNWPLHKPTCPLYGPSHPAQGLWFVFQSCVCVSVQNTTMLRTLQLFHLILYKGHNHSTSRLILFPSMKCTAFMSVCSSSCFCLLWHVLIIYIICTMQATWNINVWVAGFCKIQIFFFHSIHF